MKEKSMSEILPAGARAFVEEPRFAVLGTINKDGSPQMTVVWYELQGDTILMNTAAGRRKVHNLERDPRVALTIENAYRYVTLYGRATLEDDQEVALSDIRHLAIRYQGEQEGQRLVDEEFGKEQRVSIRVSIERVDMFGFDG
jgi:PPOX class probable F420-dependent enzyme